MWKSYSRGGDKLKNDSAASVLQSHSIPEARSHLGEGG